MAEKKMKCYGLDNDSGSGTGTEEHRGKQGGRCALRTAPEGWTLLTRITCNVLCIYRFGLSWNPHSRRQLPRKCRPACC